MNIVKIMLLVAMYCIVTVTGYAQDGKIQLLWENGVDAVTYELEIATTPIKSKKSASNEQLIYRTTGLSTAGVELPLSLLENKNLKKIYYRARPLDLDKNPVGEFSAPVPLSKGVINPQKPTPTVFLKKNHLAPLYPVYGWIPVLEATRYEVEIMSRAPENPNGVQASRYRIRSYMVEGGFDCYDTHPYVEPGTYYWRVRALDGDNEPIGTYSDAISFTVKTGNYKWAVFGDSITHGGGAISNPPSDERFEYVSYLPFPVKNLGKSGDTAEMLVERFDTEVLPFKPKYLFVLGGSNSIRGGVSGESVIESLQTIKEKCEDNQITPIFLTLPPINPERIQRVFGQPTAENWQVELEKVNNFIRNQPNAIETYSLLVDQNGILPVEYAEDGLHPDISGKKIMAGSINAFLKNHRLK
ncbi:GDSL-type esterase/lipase family protein [Pelosinus sp. sgz500959]|uniref:GDSL-type esterase/lipase family protein n=1 Tax=Pelosinus sp. sgz500959 TaxID=3242472 RepID=UPI00366E82B0